MPSTQYDYEEESSSNEEDEIEQDMEMNEESEEEDSDMDDLPVASPSKRKGKAKAQEEEQDSRLIVQTSFDAYFTYTGTRIQTSTNVFSELVLPLTAEEYAEGIQSASKRLNPVIPTLLEGNNLETLYSRFIFELHEGFNLLCYGMGSKRALLNRFAKDVCSERGHVVVANAFQPDFTIKDLLARIHSLPPLQQHEITGTPEKQAQQITEQLSKQRHHFYIIIHNIDAPPLRLTRSKAILSMLASHSLIHLVGSVDHINAPLLWSSSELSSRKSDGRSGFAWLWHDLTTLEPYDAELSSADRSSISGASAAARKKMDSATSANPTAMSETAAIHILASVTAKAKRLFALLGKKQLESIEDAGDQATNDLQQYGMAYDALFNAARDDFIAVNDTALRALLGEFRDHSLIVSAPSATGAEILYIPLRKERLQSVIAGLDAAA